MTKSILSLSLALLLLQGECSAITMPAPPPELPDTLTSFRTKEQINESRRIENELVKEEAQEVALEENPFVPGDDNSGIVRYASVYTPSMAIGIPEYGLSIVRFYDLNSVPWDINSVRTENQGFYAEVSASPSELIIKQTSGATGTIMVVTLNNYPNPLVFSLNPVRLEREGVKVNTVINAVRVKTLINSHGYVFPDVHVVPLQNPDAEVIKYNQDDLTSIEENLLEAVRGLRIESFE